MVFCGYLAYHGRLHWALVPLLLVPTVAVILFAAAVGQIVALFDVYNRDLRWVVGNVLTIWFFLLPVVYRREMAPHSLSFLTSVDPMNMIIGQFRDILYYGHISRPLHLGLVARHLRDAVPRLSKAVPRARPRAPQGHLMAPPVIVDGLWEGYRPGRRKRLPWRGAWRLGAPGRSTSQWTRERSSVSSVATALGRPHFCSPLPASSPRLGARSPPTAGSPRWWTCTPASTAT